MKTAGFKEKVQKGGEADIIINRSRKPWSPFLRISDKRKMNV